MTLEINTQESSRMRQFSLRWAHFSPAIILFNHINLRMTYWDTNSITFLMAVDGQHYVENIESQCIGNLDLRRNHHSWVRRLTCILRKLRFVKLTQRVQAISPLRGFRVVRHQEQFRKWSWVICIRLPNRTVRTHFSTWSWVFFLIGHTVKSKCNMVNSYPAQTILNWTEQGEQSCLKHKCGYFIIITRSYHSYKPNIKVYLYRAYDVHLLNFHPATTFVQLCKCPSVRVRASFWLK